jgi:hypothetical protein
LQRYCLPEVAGQEFQDEWQRLGAYLTAHGGLEEAVRRAYEVMDPVAAQRNQRTGLRTAVERITGKIAESPSPSGHWYLHKP